MAVALVTGAGRGIGRATALALARDGFMVAVLSRSPDSVRKTCELMATAGHSAIPVVADVTDPEAVRTAIAAVETAGAVEVLVNNAGLLRALGPLWQVDPADWWGDLLTSLGGTFTCCREILPRMIERGSGRIVNVVSYAAVRPAPFETGYAAAKAGMLSLTEGLAAAAQEHGVKAFAVAPGFTRTDMTDHLRGSEAGRRWLPQAGTGRVVEAEQTAELIAWLAGGAGDRLSGRCLHVLDDAEEILARFDEVARDDLYVARLRSLDPPG